MFELECSKREIFYFNCTWGRINLWGYPYYVNSDGVCEVEFVDSEEYLHIGFPIEFEVDDECEVSWLVKKVEVLAFLSQEFSIKRVKIIDSSVTVTSMDVCLLISFEQLLDYLKENQYNLFLSLLFAKNHILREAAAKKLGGCI